MKAQAQPKAEVWFGGVPLLVALSQFGWAMHASCSVDMIDIIFSLGSGRLVSNWELWL